MYPAFMDFRKFFDSIDRKALLYKLLKLGVTGKIYYIIKDMYKDTNYHIKCQNGLTHSFKSSRGVKQGCSLSPILSNIFQNDLHNIFKDDCDPIKIGISNLNSISFADDLVLMSSSPSGLQKCLDNLNEYCDKWGLSINTDKSNVMIMLKGKRTKNLQLFQMNNDILDYVHTYKYLGIVISSDGRFSKAICDRVSKAKRATLPLKKALFTTGCVSTKVAFICFR